MKFDKSRVYTAVNADELKVGSKVFLEDDLQSLKNDVFNNSLWCILDKIRTEETPLRFESDGMHYSLAYLIEPPKEPKYKPFSSIEKAMEVINKHGGWVKCKKSSLAFFIIAYDKKSIYTYISSLTGKLKTEDLYNRYVFADDGSPCGELAEEGERNDEKGKD